MPANPLGRVIDAAARGPESLTRAANLLPRVIGLLDTAERLLTRAESVLTRLEQTEERLDAVVRRTHDSERAARGVIAAVADLERRVETAMDEHEPGLRNLMDTAAYAGTRFRREQVDAVVAYLDFLPMLQALDREVVPMMSTLQSVAPDLTELLAVSRALNEIIGSMPGLGRAKRRADEQLAQDDTEG